MAQTKSMKEILKERAELTQEQDALQSQALTLAKSIRQKKDNGEDVSEDVETYKSIETKLDTVAFTLKAVAKLAKGKKETEDDDSDTKDSDEDDKDKDKDKEEDEKDDEPEGSSEDGKKNLVNMTTKGTKVGNNKSFNINNKFGGFKDTKKSGEYFGRYALLDWVAQTKGNEFARHWQKEQFNDPVMADLLTTGKSAMEFASTMSQFNYSPMAQSMIKSPLSITTATPTIPQNWFGEPIELLYASTPLLGKLPRKVVGWGGQATFFRKRLGGGVGYVGELQAANTYTMGWDRPQISWHEYAGIYDISKEDILFSPIDTAGALMDDLIQQGALFVHREIMYGPGTGFDARGNTLAAGLTSVKGLVSQINPTLGVVYSSLSNGSITPQTVRYDIGNARLAFRNNNVTMDNVFAVTCPSIDEFFRAYPSPLTGQPIFEEYLTTGKMSNVDFLDTTQIPTNEVGGASGTLANTADIFFIKPEYTTVADFGAVEVTSTDSASYYNNGTFTSAWANRTVAFQLRGFFDFLLHHDIAAVRINTSEWALTSGLAANDYYVQQAASFNASLSGSGSH